MRKLFLFMNVSLDGFFEGPGHDLSAFHNDFEAFSAGESAAVDAILLGHTTYDMMKFWATPQAAEMQPDIARFFNEREKLVASRAAFDPGWQKVTVLGGDVAGEVARLKARPGGTIAMFGSNRLCVSLMAAGLVDEFQIMLNPVVLGAGTSLFAGLPQPAALRLVSARPFKTGAVLLTYRPVEA